jgi:PIN like domain
MRELFPGYYRPTEEEFAGIWQQCIFTFDANVLLNIYRYSQTTRQQFLDILKLISDRVWLPHQAAMEYQQNRLNVMAAQYQAYDEIPKILSRALSEIKSAVSRHPFINVEELTAAVESSIGKAEELLNKAKSEHADLTDNDGLRDSLAEIFKGKVGSPFPENELEKIYSEAQKRFVKQMPSVITSKPAIEIVGRD